MIALLRIVQAFMVVVAPVVVVHYAVALLGLERTTTQLLTSFASMVVGFAAFHAYGRFVEKRTVGEFSPEGALKELASGMLIGALLFSVTLGVLAALGVYRITQLGTLSDVLYPLATAMAAAVIEEIVFRGVIFRLSEAWVGTLPALLISAIVFGFIHLLNPHATLQGALAIIFESGILLAAAYVLTRRLWLPIGIHFAWNFTQGGIFGVVVSGSRSAGLFQGKLTGPAWLSGGEFGAEGSVVAVGVCAAVGIVMLLRSCHRTQRSARDSGTGSPV